MFPLLWDLNEVVALNSVIVDPIEGTIVDKIPDTLFCLVVRLWL